jgi:hypothetical protein
MSDDHFSVDGTLIQAWTSHKSFRPKPPEASGEDGDEPPGAGSPPVEVSANTEHPSGRNRERDRSCHHANGDAEKPIRGTDGKFSPIWKHSGAPVPAIASLGSPHTLASILLERRTCLLVSAMPCLLITGESLEIRIKRLSWRDRPEWLRGKFRVGSILLQQ